MAAILGDDFRQVRGQSGNRQKCRQCDAQCIGDDQLRVRSQLRKQRQASAV